METIVAIEIEELPLPDHWHTAQECRERAESWENEELKRCLTYILEDLWEVAGKGGTEATKNICTDKPKHFYATLCKMLESLGYEVVLPCEPWNKRDKYRAWTFRW